MLVVRPTKAVRATKKTLSESMKNASPKAKPRRGDVEEERAEEDGPPQHVERDAQLHHHRHAVGGAGGGEEEAVLHGEEADHLRDGLAARDHHEEGEHD